MDRRSIIATFIVLCAPAVAAAATVPFTEDFTGGSANWKFDSAGTIDSTWAAGGGPDGDAYITQDFNFLGTSAGGTPVLFRAHDEFNASGNNFVGDWIGAGVTAYSMWVRHEGPEPLQFFTRFAGPANFPGAAAVFTPVAPNTWTQVSIAISPSEPNIVYEGPASTYFSVFGDVGHVQVGVFVPASLADTDTTLTFDLDRPAIVPEPGTLAALGLLGLVMWRRR